MSQYLAKHLDSNVILCIVCEAVRIKTGKVTHLSFGELEKKTTIQKLRIFYIRIKL